jgi:large subunit ribosomal protein L13
MSTTITREADVQRDWYVIDATDQTLGRLATRIATVLRGKHKPTFQPHVDAGDFVVVVNAEKIALSGNKLDQKFYYNYSGYAGGLKATSARQLLDTYPDRVITHAVKGMLPKNRLARQVIGKLKVYGGAEHPHTAQQPKPFPDYV